MNRKAGSLATSVAARRTCQRASSSIEIGKRSSSATGSVPLARRPRPSIASRSSAAVISSTPSSPAFQPNRRSRVDASGLRVTVFTSRRSIATDSKREGEASGLTLRRSISAASQSATASLSLPPGSAARSRFQVSRRARRWARAFLRAGASVAAHRAASLGRWASAHARRTSIISMPLGAGSTT